MAFPKNLSLNRHLGVVPYHTDFETLHTQARLSKKQRRTRDRQISNWDQTVAKAKEELLVAGLIARGEFPNSRLETTYPAFVILDEAGAPRSVHTGFQTREHFYVPASLLDYGFFWIWLQHRLRLERLPTDLEVRLMLLALRDQDLDRFGGIDPNQLMVMGLGETAIRLGTWPAELHASEADCLLALEGIEAMGFLHRDEVVSHYHDLHLIRRDGAAEAYDERNVRLYRVAA